MSTSSLSAKVKNSGRSFGSTIGGLPRSAKILLWGLLALFMYALPVLNLPLITTPDIDFAGVMFTVATYGLVALGLNIVVGYAGLLDLGYVGFYALGAYTVAVLGSRHGSWPYLLIIPVAVVVTMVSGVILGAPTLRVRGDYLAIVTLGFGEIIRITAVNLDWVNGARGITDVPRPPNIGGQDGLFEIPHLAWVNGQPLVDSGHATKVLFFGVLDAVPYYWFVLTLVILVLLADILIKESRVGRSWEATREDEEAAELMGVPTFKFKLLAFAMGAFVGGLAGAAYAGYQGFVSPDTFIILYSMLFLAAVVVGGAGNRWGVLVGAFLVVYLPERFRTFQDWRVLIFGLALMLLAIYRPQGILPPRRAKRALQVEEEIEALEGSEPEEGVEHA